MRSIEEIEKEKTKYEKKIEELNKELRDLSIQTKRNKPKKTEKKKTPLRVGDRAVITNDYKGKKGTEGNITRSTKDFTFLQDKDGVIHKRVHQNISKVNKDE